MSVDACSTERTRIVAEALDHLVRRIVINADSEHAARQFMEACEENGTLTMVDAGLPDSFLDRLLPALDILPKLPPNLVSVMIVHFDWPQTLATLGAEFVVRPDVRVLLLRHAHECDIPDPEYSLISDRAVLMVDRVQRGAFVFRLALGAVIVFGISMYLWAQSRN